MTVIAFSQINLGDRADAEYYSKDNLKVEHALREHNAELLSEFCDLTASAFYPAATDLYEFGDTPFVRCVDCINYPLITKLQDEQFERIPREFIEANKSIRLIHKGEIVLTKVGTPCYTSVVHEYEEMALSRTVMGLVNVHNISPYYLMIFLRSRYGFTQLMRQRELTIQYQLTLERVRSLRVYTGSEKFRQAIEQTVLQYFDLIRYSQEAHTQAERTLLAELGLLDWRPPEPLAYERKASAAFAAGRLDAEYFSPRVQTLLQILKRQKLTIGEVAPVRKEYFNPIHHKIFQYIEISDLSSSGEAESSTVNAGEAPDRATWYVRDGDVITSTVRPIRRLTALIHPEQDGDVCSSGFAVLQPCDVPAELLLVYLRLPIIAELMDLHTTASMYPAISVPDILTIPFLKPSPEITKQIVHAVRESHSARRSAQRLLEQAKRTVEIAIEESETAALDWLKTNMVY